MNIDEIKDLAELRFNELCKAKLLESIAIIRTCAEDGLRTPVITKHNLGIDKREDCSEIIESLSLRLEKLGFSLTLSLPDNTIWVFLRK